MPSDFAHWIHGGMLGLMASRRRPGAELSVERVEVEAMRARHQRQGLGRVAPQSSAVRACRDNCPWRRVLAEGAVQLLEAADVVPLPAVQRRTPRRAVEALRRCQRRDRRSAASRGRRRFRLAGHIIFLRVASCCVLCISLLEIEPIDVALIEEHRRAEDDPLLRTSICPRRPA